MRSRIVAAAGAAALGLCTMLNAVAAPTALSVTFPLRFGGPRVEEPARPPTAGEIRIERRLRLIRYGLQLADAIVSAIGYHAYTKCLSCLAYPGGGPAGSTALSVANLSRNRPAEVDPLIQPFSRGGIASLALGAFAYDVVDARIEKRWSTQHREAADIAEIGAHAWGISTWLPEIGTIHRDAAAAAACGAQWRAKEYGQAFSDGCVNEYFRPGGAAAIAPLPATGVLFVCAPARFKHGTYLFATAGDDILASGEPCPGVGFPSP